MLETIALFHGAMSTQHFNQESRPIDWNVESASGGKGRQKKINEKI